ncbi:MAG: class I SAM-dependent methyltransferase [Bacteroidales bacterium]|nr:class I SAM-dependent methyltransferase [Bacteroidales bacterium]MBN2756497.1 class I SAM-dependent methyltransferase [Bacteroidales bacterium]
MNWFYKNREERSKWLAKRFESEISDSKNLLDIGCYNADLKNFISKNINYTGIDIAGKPDVFLNLDKIEKLPFNDNSFDTIVCADVLEHLENIHLIFDELCRVSNKNIIITLPNAYANIPDFFLAKKYSKNIETQKQFGKHIKFYGLPLEKPDDRHRWFFSFSEAIDFIKYRAQKFNFKVSIIESEHNHLNIKSLKLLILKILRKINKNLIDRNIIILLKKQ